MMIYNLVDKNSPILKTKIDLFDFNNHITNPLDLACNLAETMLHNNGIGLAANQCGLPYRVFVLSADEIIPCFNPKIVDFSQETIMLDEGCLTYPKVFLKIERPRRIKVRYTEPSGKTLTRELHDLTARIFQHELEHLNGITMRDRVSRLQWNMAVKKASKK